MFADSCASFCQQVFKLSLKISFIAQIHAEALDFKKELV